MLVVIFSCYNEQTTANILSNRLQFVKVSGFNKSNLINDRTQASKIKYILLKVYLPKLLF